MASLQSQEQVLDQYARLQVKTSSEQVCQDRSSPEYLGYYGFADSNVF